MLQGFLRIQLDYLAKFNLLFDHFLYEILLLTVGGGGVVRSQSLESIPVQSNTDLGTLAKEREEANISVKWQKIFKLDYIVFRQQKLQIAC